MKFLEYDSSKIHIDSILQDQRLDRCTYDPSRNSSSLSASPLASSDAQFTKSKGNSAATHFGLHSPSLTPCGEYYLVANVTSEPNSSDDSTELIWSVDSSNSTGGTDVSKDDKGKNQNANGTSLGANLKTWSRKIQQVSRDLFLPVGYPHTVAGGYLEYQIYDSLQGLCSYLRGVVSTSAVLAAAGVGDAEATAMSAAMVGMFIVFLHVVSILMKRSIHNNLFEKNAFVGLSGSDVGYSRWSRDDGGTPVQLCCIAAF
mmetsp:Transcript_27840/g.58338  ORF Transcript_27840/g.58338 Transcript_27840/m.58338 type:complete len:258 (+) Transcript_27840:17-790(+)